MNLVQLTSFFVYTAAILLGVMNTLYCIFSMGYPHTYIFILTIIATYVSALTYNSFTQNQEQDENRKD